MNIGYARTSTIDQIAGFEAQIKELKESGCKKIYSEQISSIATREQLKSAIDFAREDDVLTVTKLDRLARSVTDVMTIIKTLERKKVGLRILNLGMDTKTPTGKLMLTVLSGVAQFEREIMLERQKEGVAKAKAAGKYKGRKPIAKDKQQEVINLAVQRVSKVNIARQLGIGAATVYRILKKAKNDSTPRDSVSVTEENNCVEKKIKLNLWLRVENNSKFVRGKGKVRAEIEDYLEAYYNGKKLDEDGCEYEFIVPYKDNIDLDDSIYEIVSEMASMADCRNCFIETDINSDDGRSW